MCSEIKGVSVELTSLKCTTVVYLISWILYGGSKYSEHMAGYDKMDVKLVYDNYCDKQYLFREKVNIAQVKKRGA